MNTFPMSQSDLLAFASASRDLTPEEFEPLFDYYLANDLIDYGTAKAKTGDPYLHIEHDLRRRVNDLILGASVKQPIRYRDFNLYGSDVPHYGSRVYFEHVSFDGEEDTRYGYAPAGVDALQAIDERLDA